MITGYIYRFFNKITGLSYIGQTTRTLNERIYEHLKFAKSGKGVYFSRALRKYGIENFEITVLHTVDGKDKQDLINKLNVLEVKEIEHYNSFYNGYNSTTGGNNYIFSEEAREKMSKACRGRILTKEHREAISKAKKGMKVSEETRKKLSEAGKRNKGNPNLINAHKGRKVSEETRRKISESVKASYTDEHRKRTSECSKGKIVSEETKEKLRRHNLGKTHTAETREKLRQIAIEDWKKRKAKKELEKQALLQKTGGN